MLYFSLSNVWYQRNFFWFFLNNFNHRNVIQKKYEANKLLNISKISNQILCIFSGCMVFWSLTIWPKKVVTNGWLTIYSLTCPTLLYYQAHAICPWQYLHTQHGCRPKNRGWIDGCRERGRELGNWVSALLDVEVWIKSIFFLRIISLKST